MKNAVLRKYPLRFWAGIAGFAGIFTCLFLKWVTVTNAKIVIQVEEGQGQMLNLFALLNKPESGAIRAFLFVLAGLLIVSVLMIALSIVLAFKQSFKPSKLQSALTCWGFGLSALIPLIFAVFTASVNDPAILRITILPAIQSGIALVAMILSSENLSQIIKRHWQLYILLLPALIMVFVFVYLPMYGIQIAFRDFKAAFGIAGSKWVGLKNFTDFFASYYAKRLLLNTFLLNLYGLLWAFPIPIIMAIFLNQLAFKRFKRFTQTAIYAPHFISPVVMVGMLFLFLSPTSGLLNKLIETTGGTPIAFMLESKWFRTIFISTDVWQHAGWNTILYIATLTAIDPGLYEAATIDGASKAQKIRYIDIPHLVPIIVMLFILNCGAMLTSNTDKALLMQTDPNIPTSDIIGVYVYRMGLMNGQFSYTSAINLLVNVINFVMIIGVNQLAKRTKQTTLF
ncbi:MAG: ABC transporter permease subunit [Oscillospiraceae bacterium]|nr:ABC transporter permease subunit [Oscillospiraceae bacterium]